MIYVLLVVAFYEILWRIHRIEAARQRKIERRYMQMLELRRNRERIAKQIRGVR